MESEGYEAESVGICTHDVYHKAPVYNFELHNPLYGKLHQDGWSEYYENVKERLVLNEGSSYGNYFTDEDFYVYLNAKPELDFSYIEMECEVLGIGEFEKQSRSLCKKVFDVDALKGRKALEQSLSAADKEMLAYYVSSGVYGTMERGVKNSLHKFQQRIGSKSKIRYVLGRIFPNSTVMECCYPAFGKHKILIPIGWVYRWFCILFDKERAKHALKEISLVKKAK